MTTGKTIALTRRTFVGKVMSLFLPNVLYMILDSIQDTIHLSSALPVSSWLTVSQISLAFDDIESFEMYLYFVEYPSIEICQMFFIIRSVCVCVCVWSCFSRVCLCNLMSCSLQGSSVHGILQARTLEWLVISFSRRSTRHMDRTRVPCIAGKFFTIWATMEAHN